MTREEADVALYLVDQLRDRGARLVEVAGVKAAWDSPPVAPRDPDRPLTEKEKLGQGRAKYERKLFGALGIGDAKGGGA